MKYDVLQFAGVFNDKNEWLIVENYICMYFIYLFFCCIQILILRHPVTKNSDIHFKWLCMLNSKKCVDLFFICFPDPSVRKRSWSSKTKCHD